MGDKPAARRSNRHRPLDNRLYQAHRAVERYHERARSTLQRMPGGRHLLDQRVGLAGQEVPDAQRAAVSEGQRARLHGPRRVGEHPAQRVDGARQRLAVGADLLKVDAQLLVGQHNRDAVGAHAVAARVLRHQRAVGGQGEGEGRGVEPVAVGRDDLLQDIGGLDVEDTREHEARRVVDLVQRHRAGVGVDQHEPGTRQWVRRVGGVGLAQGKPRGLVGNPDTEGAPLHRKRLLQLARTLARRHDVQGPIRGHGKHRAARKPPVPRRRRGLGKRVALAAHQQTDLRVAVGVRHKPLLTGPVGERTLERELRALQRPAVSGGHLGEDGRGRLVGHHDGHLARNDPVGARVAGHQIAGTVEPEGEHRGVEPVADGRLGLPQAVGNPDVQDASEFERAVVADRKLGRLARLAVGKLELGTCQCLGGVAGIHLAQPEEGGLVGDDNPHARPVDR